MDGRGRQSAALTKRRSPAARRSTEIKRFLLRNKWLARAGTGLAVAALGAGLWAVDAPGRIVSLAIGVKSFAGRAAGLTVERVTIDGLAHLKQSEIRRALAIPKGKGLYDFDVAAARARILANPWAADVTITRLPPDRLHVAVRERVPAFLWQHGKVFEAVDAGGGVITRVDPNDHTDLFFVVGEGAAQAAPALLEELSKAPIVADHVRSSVFVGGRRWDLHFDNHLVIELPDRAISSALALASKMITEEDLLDREVAVLDLRNPDQPRLRLERTALKPKPGKDT